MEALKKSLVRQQNASKNNFSQQKTFIFPKNRVSEEKKPLNADAFWKNEDVLCNLRKTH